MELWRTQQWLLEDTAGLACRDGTHVHSCAFLTGPFSSATPQQDAGSLEQGTGGPSLRRKARSPGAQEGSQCKKTRGRRGGCDPGVWTSSASGDSGCGQSRHFVERLVPRRSGAWEGVRVRVTRSLLGKRETGTIGSPGIFLLTTVPWCTHTGTSRQRVSWPDVQIYLTRTEVKRRNVC